MHALVYDRAEASKIYVKKIADTEQTVLDLMPTLKNNLKHLKLFCYS